MKYRVIGPVARFGADTELELSKEQASSRSHMLREVGRGRFVPTGELQFKTGEVIGLNIKPEALPRYLADALEPAKAEKALKSATADTDPPPPPQD